MVQLNRKPRSLMRHLAYAGLVLSAFIAVMAGRPTRSLAAMAAGTSVQHQDEISPLRVRSLMVLPGETVTFTVVIPHTTSRYVAHPTAGDLVSLGEGRWQWTSPTTPGLYPIEVTTRDGRDAVTVQAFVVVPHDQVQDGLLNGYPIGYYPDKPRSGIKEFGPPIGFIEVTPENEDVLVSPHFRLGQFICKQAADSRKYVVLNERLLLVLEHALVHVNAAGHRASTFRIMSGYRTPAYNRLLGNARYSLHQWGAAADIFIDEDGDGVMDDLNGDGRSDIRDADVLYRLVDEAGSRAGVARFHRGIGQISFEGHARSFRPCGRAGLQNPVVKFLLAERTSSRTPRKSRRACPRRSS